ncbi:MAG TPA: PhoPQ-activated pathogenicity [Verrucomicrobiales bacterium]|mgnify:FL=1|nr:PhoPQ-activated pathogenicity [Verrucomicrobiales bacterium]
MLAVAGISGSLTGCYTYSNVPALGPTARRSALHPPTALDRYVAAPDTNYAWKVVATRRVENCTVSVLQLTSQAWLTTNEVDRPVWQHWLTVARPDDAKSSVGLLFITGGSNKGGAPSKTDDNIIRAAVDSHSVVAELRNVPSQPLVFKGETRTRVEDELIAYSWDKFLRTGDDRWPARLPMTKSAVRAMDAVTAFCGSAEGGGVRVDRFVVAGGSKRGWTTWTTAVVDNRVVAIVPLVIDLLNIVPSFTHHWEAYGFWAPAVTNYVEMGIMNWTGTREYAALMKIEEPYEYRDRLTMPKFIINACGDQFFLPDSSQYYFKDLPGVKYLRYVPNADHSLRGSDAWQSLIACHDAIVRQAPLPRFSWTREADGSLRVKVVDAPKEVRLWQASNPKARDFRLETLGKAWQSQVLTDQGGGTYVGRPETPSQGWTAFMVELTYPSTGPYPFKFTTEVVVTPDKTPYKYVLPSHP